MSLRERGRRLHAPGAVVRALASATLRLHVRHACERDEEGDERRAGAPHTSGRAEMRVRNFGPLNTATRSSCAAYLQATVRVARPVAPPSPEPVFCLRARGSRTTLANAGLHCVRVDALDLRIEELELRHRSHQAKSNKKTAF